MAATLYFLPLNSIFPPNLPGTINVVIQYIPLFVGYTSTEKILPGMTLKVLLVIMMTAQAFSTRAQTEPALLQYSHNKQIPPSIRQNVLKALSYYPELKDTPINFLFKSALNSSVMQAQPVYSSLLGRKKNRLYRINISSEFRLIQSHLPIMSIPDEVMIGWIGHELGHILDYEGRSNTDMIAFGYKYLFRSSFVKHAEMLADSYAVERGMGNYIVATKRFILNHAELPQSYKDKISRLYLSPDVIVEKVKALEEKNLQYALSND